MFIVYTCVGLESHSCVSVFLPLQLCLLSPFPCLWLLLTSCCPRRKELSLNFPPPLFLCFVMCQDFLRGVFLVFLQNLCESGSGTVAVARLQSPLSHCIWYWLCTNKPDLTCLQLHHSSKACVCLNQSCSLCMLSVSPSRHVPMICYYLFPSLLTKKVTWHLPWGFNHRVSWRTRKMAFTVIEFRGP